QPPLFPYTTLFRSLNALDDPLEKELALGRLELLRVLLGLGQRSQVVLELVADVALDDLEARLLEDPVQRGAHLDLTEDVLLAGVHVQLGSKLVRQLLDDRARLAQALGLDPLADPARVLRIELGGELGVEVLRLPGSGAKLLLRVDRKSVV